MNHTIISHDVEPPTHAEMFVGMISKTADIEITSVLKPVSIRIPLIITASFDALAQYSGHTRSKLMIQGLQASLEQLWNSLAEEEREELEALRSKILVEQINDDDTTSGKVL